MPSLLIVSYLFPPDFTVGAKRALRMAAHLSEMGWEVQVLAAREGAYEDLDRTVLPVQRRFKLLRTVTFDPKGWTKKVLDAARRRRASTAGAAVESMLPPGQGRLARALSTAWDALFSFPDVRAGWMPSALPTGIWRVPRPDLILATVPPFTDAIVGAMLSCFRRVPLVLDYRDPWSALRQRAPGGIRLPRWRRRIDQAIEIRCLRRASLVVATTDGIRKELELMGAGRTVVVPNAFDAAAFAAVEPTRFDRFTIVYAGTFYESRSAEPILRALGTLRDRGGLPPGGLGLRVLGASGQEVRTMADRMGVSALLEIEGFLPHREAIARMKGADLLLLVVGEEHGRQIPAKLFEYLAAGPSILAVAPPGSDAEAVIAEAQAGSVVAPGDSEGLVEALRGRLRAGRVRGTRPAGAAKFEARATMLDLDRHLREVLG